MLRSDIINFDGVVIGLCTFLIIGLFHPIVIKGEYYFGKKTCRMFFLIIGVITLIGSLLWSNTIGSILLGVTSFSAFWGIGEVNEQEKRVARGWFPANPKRKK